MGDLTGKIIAGKYELLARIGQGGMGAVYEARNISTLKRCAVKVLLTPELIADEEISRRFSLEAIATGMIESEHVVAAYDAGVDEHGHAYYVMDALRGEDLKQTLARVGVLPASAVAKIILQAATGLASAHALGIVHRDVKPANLFLAVGAEREIKVKILDFGVAKVKMDLLHETTNALTRTGSMLGTPMYMSPEQAKRASEIDESADVWSLGVVLFECLSGKLPWIDVESFGELIAAVLVQDLPRLQDVAAWVPPELASIVHHALSRDIGCRTRNVVDLSTSLRRFLGGDLRLFEHELTSVSELERSAVAIKLSLDDTLLMPAGRQSNEPVVASPRPLARRPGRLALAGAAICAVTGAGAWLVSSRNPAPTELAARRKGTAPSAMVSSGSKEARAGSAGLGEPELDFALEIGKVPVKVRVDGVSRVVENGYIRVVGPIGSRHQIDLALNNLQATYTVVMSSDGLVPSDLTIQIAELSKPHQRKLLGPTKPADSVDGLPEKHEPESDGGLVPW